MATANLNGSPAPPKVAVIYCRYSPRPSYADEDECESLEFQEAFVRKYFDYHEIEVARVIGDPDTSARLVPLSKRKFGAELLDLTTGRQPKYGIVGAYRLDRLFRDVVDGNITLRSWRKSGVQCHFAAEGGQAINTATATGRFIVNMLLAKAQYEPDLTSERTSAAMQHRLAQGYAINSTPPYGKMVGESVETQLIGGGTRMRKTWVDNPDEKVIIERIVSWHRDGWSAAAIARQLTEQGVPPRGNFWNHPIVGRIIKRALAEAS
jgi:DNA invertase Pin-like site-specific DNA recombinase